MKSKEAAQKASKKTAVISAVVNTFLSITKITIGFVSGSTALVADGIHSFADLISDAFVYIMLAVSHIEADESHQYGHGKFETFGTFVMATLLAFTSIGIMFEAAGNLEQNHMKEGLAYLALIAAFISMVANEFLYFYCKMIGEKVKSTLVIANAWHHRSDSLSSVAAFIGIGFTMLGFPIGDSIAAFFVAGLLFKMAYQIGKSAFDELVDAAIDKAAQRQMVDIIKNVTGVINCHYLRARKVGGKIFVDVHVEVSPKISVSEGHAIAELVEFQLKNNVDDIDDVVVHIDMDSSSHMENPSYPERAVMKKIIEIAIKNNLQDCSLKKFYMHFYQAETNADIIISGAITKQQAEKLKRTIVKPKGPFNNVSISKEL